MTNIVPIKPKISGSEKQRDTTLVCKCGCTTFRIHGDASVFCGACDVPILGVAQALGLDGSEWCKLLPTKTKIVPIVEDNTFKVSNISGPEVFLMQLIKKGAKDIAAIICLNADNDQATSIYISPYNIPSESWIEESMETAKLSALLKIRHKGPTNAA